jgi:hypothetical protein
MDEAMRGAKTDIQAIAKEAAAVLTDEQRVQLKQVSGDRMRTEMATGGLGFLATPQAREQFAFSADQAEKIKSILKDLGIDVRRAGEEAFGPGKQPAPEELRSEKFAPLRDQQRELVKKALDRIMTILTSQQRQQVEKWWASQPQPGGGPKPMKKHAPPPAEPGTKGYGNNT